MKAGHLVHARSTLLSPNYSHHDNATLDFGPGPEAERQRVNPYRSAFPDLLFTIEDMIAEGDIVTITVTGITINRFGGGKIVEGWVNWDALGMLQQLGVIPTLFKAKGAAN